LLKLAFGDLQPAWGGKISRFNFPRKRFVEGQKKIGYISLGCRPAIIGQ